MHAFIACPHCGDGEITAEVLVMAAETEAGFVRVPAHAELVDYHNTCGCVLTEWEVVAAALRGDVHGAAA
jgi:hypothetical protein